MIGCWLLFAFTFCVSRRLLILCGVVKFSNIYRLRRFQPCSFSAPESFFPLHYRMKNRSRSQSQISGVDLWHLLLWCLWWS